MDFEQTRQAVLRGVKTAFETFGKSCQSYLIAYFVLTTFLMFMDFVALFLQIGRFGESGVESSSSNIILMLICLVFLFMDYQYFLWILNLRMKLPQEISTAVNFAFLGGMSKIN